MCLDMVLADKALATGPSCGRLVKNVVDFDLVGSAGSHGVEFILEKDILGGDVRVDQGYFSLVGRVPGDGLDDLVHGGDPSTAGQHAKVANKTGRVVELALRSLDTNLLSDFHLGDVFRDISHVISLF